ncbi:MAG TPA: hypothetical protein VLC08_02340 [Chitinolyticbacter sp.]|nr:hypothetical protein [Chitinolyticbacter sp.]
MLKRFRSSPLAALVALLLVFSQLVTAAYACERAISSASLAPPIAMSAPVMEMPTDCAEMQQMDEPVICKAHCEKDAQSADVKLPILIAPMFAVLFFASPYADAADAARPAMRPFPPTLIAASPPLRIQYQVFRT